MAALNADEDSGDIELLRHPAVCFFKILSPPGGGGSPLRRKNKLGDYIQ